MNTNFKAAARGPKFFSSDNFLMQLNLHQNGVVNGWVVHFPIGLNLVQSFTGISVEENGSIKFSFFIEWRNPNLNSKVLTAYSGEIFSPEGTEPHLPLEWLQISEDSLSLASYKGFDVLRGLSEKDPLSQARRLAFLELLEKSFKHPWSLLGR